MESENTPCTGNVMRSSLLDALKRTLFPLSCVHHDELLICPSSSRLSSGRTTAIEARPDAVSAVDDANDFLSELDDVTFTPKPAAALRAAPPARVVAVMETPKVASIPADMTPIAPATHGTGSPNSSYEIRRVDVSDLNETKDDGVDESVDQEGRFAAVHSGPSTPIAAGQQREATEEERIQRELAESEALALQLMQEEVRQQQTMITRETLLFNVIAIDLLVNARRAHKRTRCSCRCCRRWRVR
jgi:hypothetical protein